MTLEGVETMEFEGKEELQWSMCRAASRGAVYVVLAEVESVKQSRGKNRGLFVRDEALRGKKCIWQLHVYDYDMTYGIWNPGLSIGIWISRECQCLGLVTR